MAKDCCKSPAASFRHRVTIQNPVRVSDGQGGFTETYPDGDSIWAAIEPVKGWERMQAMQMQTPVTHKITVRYRSDINTASRLKFGSRIFWVREALNPGEMNAFLEIKACERA